MPQAPREPLERPKGPEELWPSPRLDTRAGPTAELARCLLKPTRLAGSGRVQEDDREHGTQPLSAKPRPELRSVWPGAWRGARPVGHSCCRLAAGGRAAGEPDPVVGALDAGLSPLLHLGPAQPVPSA